MEKQGDGPKKSPTLFPEEPDLLMNNSSHDTDFSVLAIDIGTSGCRAILFGFDGTIISMAEKQYKYHYDSRNGFAEQNPFEIYESFTEVIKKCLSLKNSSIKHIVLSSALHSLILVDNKGKPLTPVSIWADSRATGQCLEIQDLYTRKGWYQKTGCPLSPSYPLYRLLWYREHHPKLYKIFARVLSIKSYILFRLFGCYVEDHSIASGTGLFNIYTRDWDEEILDYLELNRIRFPDLVPVEHQIRGVSIATTKKLGLSENITWIIGASDGPLAHLGSAGYCPNIASLTIGTSGAVRVLSMSKKPLTSLDSPLWCYVLDSKSYVSGIATNNGGNVVDWYVRTFLPKEITWQEIEKNLESTTFEPNLFFIPFLFEERFMIIGNIGSNLSATLIGIKHRHSTYDYLRAIIEGIVFNMISLLNQLQSFKKVSEVAISGSLIKSHFVFGILSSVMNDIVVKKVGVNASLLGAFRIGMGKDFHNLERNCRNYTGTGKETSLKNDKRFAYFPNYAYPEKYFKWKQLCTTKM